jgi:hypothetical protein
MHAGGVQEGRAAQVECDASEAGVAQTVDLRGHLRHRVEIELADGTHPHERAIMLDIDTE